MKYSVIYADPPWEFRNKKTGGSGQSGSEAQYSVMSVSEVCALNVRAISANDSFLFMWWVASQPGEALRVVSSWGFRLCTMTGFSWIKKTITGKDAFGMGFYTRQQQEHVLIARRGIPAVLSHSVRQNVRARVREHSRKPDEVRGRIIELCGDVPRLEMFARPPVPDGWDVWGNAVNNSVEIMGVTKTAVVRKIRKKTLRT